MKAIYITKYGPANKAFEIRETSIPEPKPNEVVIKNSHFGINFADVLARKGLYPDAPAKPSLIGYDVAGHIHAIGSQVDNLKVGDRVTALTRFGGYAEYAATMAEGVCVINDEVPMADATALSTQGCTAYFCINECATLHNGDHILIQAAAGGVGSLMVQMAKEKGCYIYGTASTKKQDFLKELGVDVPIDYATTGFEEIIAKDRDKGKPLHFVFDSIGGKSFKKAYKLLSPGGKMIFFGAASQLDSGGLKIVQGLKTAAGFGIFSPLQLIMASKSMIGVNMLRIADNNPSLFRHCLQSVVKLYEDGIIVPKIDKIFEASQIDQAHDYLESRKSIGKIVCKW